MREEVKLERLEINSNKYKWFVNGKSTNKSDMEIFNILNRKDRERLFAMAKWMKLCNNLSIVMEIKEKQEKEK